MLTKIHELFYRKRRGIETRVKVQHFGQARHGGRDGREAHGKNTHVDGGSVSVCV